MPNIKGSVKKTIRAERYWDARWQINAAIGMRTPLAAVTNPAELIMNQWSVDAW